MKYKILILMIIPGRENEDFNFIFKEVFELYSSI